MGISSDAINQFEMIKTEHGTTVTLYDPTITYNDEGDETITLGTGSDVSCVIFTISPEEMQWSVEGIDLTQTYRCYFSNDTNIDKETIVKYNGIYYKIHSLSNVVVEGQTVYKMAVITKSELNI